MTTFFCLLSTILEYPVSVIRQDKETKSIHTGKEEVDLSLLADKHDHTTGASKLQPVGQVAYFSK